MKDTEVPNPWRSRLSHACHMHSVLFLPMHSLLKGFRLSHACFVHSVLFLPIQSSLTSFWRSFTDLVQLIFSFPSYFTLSDSTDLIRFIAFVSQITLCFSFGSKDMITAFTCLPSYRYSSCTLRAYLCWRHTYCQWPIIELAKNVSPKNKIAASHVVQIHMHARFLRSGWLIV